MVPAIMMTNEQIAKLVDLARADPVLWVELKDRETNQFHEDGSPKIPSLSMLVRDFVNRQYKSNHGFDVGSLIIALSRQTRLELGMPID